MAFGLEAAMIEKLAKILKDENLGIPVEASARIVPSKAANQPDLHQQISAFNPQEGWLCLTDEVVVIRKPQDMEKIKDRIVLSGELVSGTTSLHIRQESDFWLLHLITKHSGGGLMLKESFASIPQAYGVRLKYETFWQDVSGTLKPHVSRFAGYTPKMKKGKEERS